MSARRMVVWRHGRTAWNATGRFQGQADIPLDETGLAQAAEAAPVIAATYAPAAIVASDLARAAQTADALAAVTGLPVAYDEGLREIDVGAWAGFVDADVERLDPTLHARLRAGDPDARRGGTGETLRELADRAEKAFGRALESVGDDQTVVAVCHGLMARVGLAQLVGVPVEQSGGLAGMRNCGWAVVEPRHDRPGYRLAGWNLSAVPAV